MTGPGSLSERRAELGFRPWCSVSEIVHPFAFTGWEELLSDRKETMRNASLEILSSEAEAAIIQFMKCWVC